MNALKIVLALIKVPRLFASLLLFPLLGSLVIVLAQLILSGSALRQINKEEQVNKPEEVKTEEKDWQFLRAILYGKGAALASPILCKWIETDNESKAENFPSPECAPDKLDIALHIQDGKQVDLAEYMRLIDGNAQRLHVCKSCKPDLELFVTQNGNYVKTHSSYGLMLYSLLMLDKKIQEQYQLLKSQRNELKERFGEVFFYLPELKSPVEITSLEISLIFILNITGVVVIALWLGLKAHRKVLDYFSKSGALLPMVAATGKNSFYLALWGITSLRVILFLLASIPLMLLVFEDSPENKSVYEVFNHSLYELLLWLLTLLSSMALATLIASISDLKGRHELMSILYKILPLLLSALGAFFWCVSFLAVSENAAIFRSFVTAFPIFGMVPVILAPVIQPQAYILIIHTISSLILVRYLMKKNAHWFAAHLEEL